MNKNIAQLGQLSPSTQLYSAAESGNTKRVKELLVIHGPNVFNTRSYGNTALYIAFMNNHIGVVDLILEAIQETSTFSNILNSMGLTYLHIACTRKNEKVIQGFLDAEANTEDTVTKNSPHWAGFNALHFAAKFQSLTALKTLLAAGMDCSRKTCSGKTALDLLNESLFDPLIMVDLLEGRSWMQRNFSNFQIACMNEDKTAVQKFIDHGAAKITSKTNCEFPIALGYTPLHLAVVAKCKDKVEFLLQSGAKVEITDNKNMTPLHLALYGQRLVDYRPIHYKLHSMLITMKPSVEIIQLLYAAVEDKMASHEDTNGLSFFHAAIVCNDLSTVKNYLQDGKANVNKPLSSNADNFANYTPLHMAVQFEHLELAELLIKYGADVNASDNKYGTPLHMTLKFRRNKLFELFMKQAKLDIITPRDQETIMHLLVNLISSSARYLFNEVSKESISMYIEQVAKLGVDVNAKNIRGDTALHFFRSRFPDWATYFQTLLDLGADINLRNNDGKLPFNSNEWDVKHTKYQVNVIFHHHVQKLKALGLTVDSENEETCSLIVQDGECFDEEELIYRKKQRLEEIAVLKSITVGEATSLYNFIKLEPGRTVLYADCASLKDIAQDKDLKKKFPSYAYLIRLKYREATGLYGTIAKKRLNLDVDGDVAHKRQRFE